jgi:hypothetical protein
MREHGEIGILLEDGNTLILDSRQIDTTWPSVLFLTRRWALIFSLSLIVLLFAANEFK